MAFALRYPGTCSCGQRLAAGSMATYAGGRITSCCYCEGTNMQVKGAPSPKPVAARSSYRAPAAPTCATPAEATANLAALLAKLDSDQSLVANWKPSDGSTRIVACAGAGKTTSMVALVGKLLAEGADAEGLVVTTFTNKAAAELTERLAKVMTADTLKALRVGTFHALALKGLRAAGQTKWDMDFCVDTRGSKLAVGGRLLMTCIVNNDPHPDKGPSIKGLSVLGHGLLMVAGPYSQLIDCLRSDGCTIADYRSNKRVKIERSEVDGIERVNGLVQFESVWKTYEAAKREQGGWDFADALAAYLQGLRDGTVADGAQVCLVDEAQDNSHLQIGIARELAGSTGKVIMVGDCRQAIFGFRGADPELFMQADKTLGAKTLQIRSNYRSGRSIVTVGNRVAEGKTWSLGDPAVAKRDLDGLVKTMSSGTAEAEAQAIASEIALRVERDSTSLADFAVLARTNWEIGLVESACYRAKVPCCVAGGSSFFASRDVQDFIAMLTIADGEHAVVPPSIDDKLFLRLVKRTEYLGIEYARAVERARGGSAYLPAMAAVVGGMDKRRKAASAKLYEAIKTVASLLGGQRTKEGWDAACAAASSWLLEMHEANAAAAEAAGEAPEDATGMAMAISSIAANFASLDAFVKFCDDCSRDTASIGENDALPVARATLSTIHKAKGREWRIVYLLASSGRFPHAKATSDEEAAGEERLFYVGVTRAKDELTVSCAMKGWKDSPAGPSIFWTYLSDEQPDDGPGGGSDYEDREASSAAAQLSAHDDFFGAEHDGFMASLTPAQRAATTEAEFDAASKLTPAEFDKARELPDDAKARALARHVEAMKAPFVPDWVAEESKADEESMAADADALDDPAVAARLSKAEPVATTSHLYSWSRGLLHKALLEMAVDAEKLTKASPKAADGSRYVQPTLAEFTALLSSLNAQRASFDVEERSGQIVFEVKVEQALLRIFTTIAIGDAGARGVGEDSIKISCVQASGGQKPITKQQPYAQRTRGWRTTLVKKLVETVERLGPVCIKCGSQSVLRGTESSQFYGCSSYPGCKQTSKLPVAAQTSIKETP